MAAGQNVLVRLGPVDGDGDGLVQYKLTVGDTSSLEDPDEVRVKLVDDGMEEKINTGVWGCSFTVGGRAPLMQTAVGGG